MTTPTRLLALTLCAAAPLALAACGSSDDDASRVAASATGERTTSTAGAARTPEEVFAPDAEVAAGLRRLVRVARGVAASPDPATSRQVSEGLEPVWRKVEGTVKRNEPDRYATIEEDLSLLSSGVARRTRQGSAEMARSVDAYLAEHPG
jgi:hypothetical protein